MEVPGACQASAGILFRYAARPAERARHGWALAVLGLAGGRWQGPASARAASTSTERLNPRVASCDTTSNSASRKTSSVAAGYMSRQAPRSSKLKSGSVTCGRPWPAGPFPVEGCVATICRLWKTKESNKNGPVRKVLPGNHNFRRGHTPKICCPEGTRSWACRRSTTPHPRKSKHYGWTSSRSRSWVKCWTALSTSSGGTLSSPTSARAGIRPSSERVRGGGPVDGMRRWLSCSSGVARGSPPFSNTSVSARRTVTAHCRTEVWRALHRRAVEGRTLVFVDGSGFHLPPSVVRTCGPQGQTPIVKKKLTRDYLLVTAGLKPTGKSCTLVHRESLSSEGGLVFLKHLVVLTGAKLLVVWDGSPIPPPGEPEALSWRRKARSKSI